ncbi:hypothetical protein EJB05_25109, partial [Eragrostis curvula]
MHDRPSRSSDSAPRQPPRFFPFLARPPPPGRVLRLRPPLEAPSLSGKLVLPHRSAADPPLCFRLSAALRIRLRPAVPVPVIPLRRGCLACARRGACGDGFTLRAFPGILHFCRPVLFREFDASMLLLRFQDWRSVQSGGSDTVVSERGHTVFGLLKDTTVGAFSFLANSSNPETLNKSASEEIKPKTRVLDPQEPFLQRWNKIFVISCLVAVFVDPLFFYIPFRTGFIAPSSRVFGRGVLVEDTFAIGKRYLSTYFLVDFLAVLPLPQGFGALWTNAFENNTFLQNVCPANGTEAVDRIFGIFIPAIKNVSGYVEPTSFFEKLFYCFWWGLQSLSSLGQNLKTSTDTSENLFAVFVSASGLVLFALLIGNVQTYLQSTSTRIEEMRMKRRDTEQWMAHRLLPENLKDRIMRHEQYKWQETRGVDEEGILANLPKDLRREIKRHLCLSLLMKLLDAMCDRLKPMLYTEGSCIIREGDPVNEMLFIMRGTLESMTTNGGQTGFFNSNVLKGGDFCGEELLTWALDPTSASNLPVSTRTVKTLTEVEAFALMADDLKFVATQFRRLHSKQLQHTFRFYSQQWRTWAACFIQAAWHRYCRKKLEETLYEKEKRLQEGLKAAIVCDGTTPLSLGAALYASRFAGNMMRILRRNATRKARLQERVPVRLLQKPAEPNFFVEDRTGFVAPSSGVFGRRVLVEDTCAIAKRYLSEYFLVDFLAVLPLPQVFVLYMLPQPHGSEVMNARTVLVLIVICQYVPRLIRIVPLYLQITRSAGTIMETAWTGAAFNLLIYMLASHTYLQSASVHIEETRVKRSDIEQWMAHRFLPEYLKERIMRHEQYRWQETQGVDEEGLLVKLPKDLRRDIKRHLCLSLLMRVPMFKNMDDQLLDAMCDRLKPMLYTEGSCIVREGDPVNEMLFIMRGSLESMTTNGGQTGFFNSNVLEAGDFCGEELLTWALDPNSASTLPCSTRTAKTLSEVEAFALKADDLKFVATQFRRLHSKQLRHTFRFYSQQWRTWAACFIQAAWRRYSRKKLEDTLYEKEKRLQAAIVSDASSSLSLGAALYASRFAGNMMRILRRNATRKARFQERMPARLLQKPSEPNFFAEDQSSSS